MNESLDWEDILENVSASADKAEEFYINEVLPHDKRSLLEIVVESELLDEYRNKLDS